MNFLGAIKISRHVKRTKELGIIYTTRFENEKTFHRAGNSVVTDIVLEMEEKKKRKNETILTQGIRHSIKYEPRQTRLIFVDPTRRSAVLVVRSNLDTLFYF